MIFQMLHLSIKELQKQLTTQSLSVVNILKQTLRRVEQIKDLNAFVTVRDENEIYKDFEAANNESTRDNLNLSLRGVTVAVKDNFCVTNTKTTCGSKMLDNFVAPYTATVVQRSIRAGGLVVGKTNLDEFAMGSGTIDSYYGPCRNIWRSGIPYILVNQDNSPNYNHSTESLPDSWPVAGGSSGGTAVAVASGAATVGLGSDTGGSVRIPAAWCGIPSLKPSYGLLSRHGLIPLVNSLDVPGIMARNIEDIQLYFEVLRGKDENDSTSVVYNCEDDVDIDNIKLGVPVEYFCEGMTNESIQAVSDTCHLFSEYGISVDSVSLPNTDLAVPCYSVLNPCEVASNMARYDGVEFGLPGSDVSFSEAMAASSRSTGFNDVVRGRILAGNYFLLRRHYEEYFLQALKIRRMIQNDFTNAFKTVDYLITPVTLSDAPSYQDFMQQDNRTQTAKQDHCTQPVNLGGLPAVTIPVSLSSRALPLSVQLIGPYGSDRKLLKIAKWIESKVSFPKLEILSTD
jgi:aspartyl-tRNA(Asn)/glutamyl-tRNA(Gln) amidotransferase subunit A